MSTRTLTTLDPDWSEDDDVVELLRSSGEHPLMTSFPHGAVFSFDRDLRYLSAGGHGLAKIGLSRESMEGRTVFEVLPARTAAVVEPLYRAALAGESSSCDVRHGNRIHELRLAPVRGAGGQVVAGIGFVLDVTEARRAEQALRESEQRNRLTFEHAPIGKAIVDLDGSWLQVNPAVTRLTGYSEEQLLAMTFQDITHPDDLDLDLGYLARLMAGEIDTYQIEKRYLTASGQTVHVLLSVALARDETGAPLYFISQIHDVTDRKRQQQALLDLTAMLAHDLRTPTAVIGGFAELLEDLAGEDPPEVRAYAARISAGARAMTALLDNALTVTALDSGELVGTPHAVGVRGSVEAVLQPLEVGSTAIDLSAVEDVAAWVDPVHLAQVVTNLLTNALKYGGSTVLISASTTGGRTRISVADDGPGVDPDFVPYLFDRFSRATDARAGRQRGSGLGLHIVRDLLAANAGTIDYHRVASGGSAFVVDLPAAEPRREG